jgi:hypothetical protein
LKTFLQKNRNKTIYKMTLKSPRTNNRKKIFTVDETDVQNKIELKTLHFNFTDSFAKELAAFAEIHRNDERKVFKSAWRDNFCTLLTSPPVASSAAVIPECRMRWGDSRLPIPASLATPSTNL